MRKNWALEAIDLSIHSNKSPAASRGLKGGASSNNKYMKSWNYLLQDTKMDAKRNCKSGDKFTLKYYSLSVSTWESPEIIADGKQNMEANDYMFALSLYSHLQILCCWALSGEEY